MRNIDVKIIEDTVRDLCIKANLHLSKSLEDKIKDSVNIEKSPIGREIFMDLAKNIKLAREQCIPICQDTGMAIIFMEIGQEVHFENGNLVDAINKGVSRGYIEGYLRCSIVSDPLERVNTNDNTPAVIHTSIVEGDKVKINVCPKGFGSENMSALKMFTPSATTDEIINFVVNSVSTAGSNPCPPIIVGVGIGGSFEYSAYLAKKALCRDLSIRNPKPLYADLELKMLEKINQLGIGPQGFGGSVTALGVNIEEYATHIAGLPVAVNIGCHVTRHASVII
ncbi:MAG: fumarate hydratase [Clostridiales bacterium]|nr:fumarate hydratase [Clostridiales bacterium]